MKLLFFIVGFLIFPLKTLSAGLSCEEGCYGSFRSEENTISASRVPKGFLRKALGRKKWAENILGRSLSVAKTEAIELANIYKESEWRQKQYKILNQAGFSKEDIQRLIRNRVVRFTVEDITTLIEHIPIVFEKSGFHNMKIISNKSG